MDGPLDFAVTVSMNSSVSRDAAMLHAIVAVTAQESAAPAASASARVDTAVAIMIDCSLSMNASLSMDDPSAKIEAARQATKAAIDALRDGDRFAVIAGRNDATMVYPLVPVLAVASAQTRAEAKDRVATLLPSGGTAMGRWLTLARQLLELEPTAVRHAILLTDGNNESEPEEAFEQALDGCAGRFVCDARGIGAGWHANRLLHIAARLRGTADAARAPKDLVADFEAMIRTATARVVPDMTLRLMVTPPAHLRFFKQVFPLYQDLTEDARWASERAADVSTGAWQAETRHYHLCVDLAGMGWDRTVPGMRVARIEAQVEGLRVGHQVPVAVQWSDDPVAASRIDDMVAHYTGQGQLSQAITAGCEAYDARDFTTAQAKFVEAVRLAWGSDNQEQLARLRRLVHLDDAASGKVRLRDDIHTDEVKFVELGSYLSIMSKVDDAATSDPPPPPPPPPPAAAPPAVERVCTCGYRSAPGSPRCNKCGAEFGPDGDDR